jgi:hypothetical protein
MKKLVSVLAGSLVLLAGPTTAFAVNVSSGDGSGTQSASKWYSCGGAYLGGYLRSTNGDRVYYNGAVVYDGATGDEQYGRYTGYVTSKTAVAVRGQIGPARNGCQLPPDGAHVKVCRDKTLWPDPCGGWSQKMKSPWD